LLYALALVNLRCLTLARRSQYTAIDGVAPRAKLNQQRSRRFRSAKDLAEATKGKKIVPIDGADVGAVDPYAGAFDSNCITPGTEFLLRISDCIRYFIRKKIKEDPLWRNLSVIFSGPEVPGEGEHKVRKDNVVIIYSLSIIARQTSNSLNLSFEKIMQHIRDMRNQPGYQPNTRHCMYGQDADLIMLGLVSHEPHFTLLREIIDFSGGFSRNDNALKEVKKFTKQSDFQLLHLSILREYLQFEFAYKHNADTYNLERLIDDFVFMTFLVGNDFLPHMPSLDIGDGAFMLLFETYKEQRANWGQDQYLTNAGEISDGSRLESFLEVIGAAESEIFAEREKNEVVQLKKQRNWAKRDGKSSSIPSDMELHAEEESKQSEYMTMVQSTLADISLNGGKVVDGWAPDQSQKDHKGRYYWEKLHLKPTDVNGHLELRKSYIEGLIWCLAYYYRGCISWGWFFPYHYGPMISDLTNLPEVFSTIKFELGQPLKPFEQLMGCLPPASSSLVPRMYRKLMCAADSPIKQFYPDDFVVDMNGKR
jgi:5'-3' exoribonuclease 1